jgi:hypothetical protein
MKLKLTVSAFLGCLFVVSSTLSASDVVVDNETGLMWQDSSTIVKKNYSGAKQYCSKLTLGGYSDWELPHIDMLMSISDATRYKPAIKPIFRHTKNSWYWSRSFYKKDSSQAWGVDFYVGRGIYTDKSLEDFVRCVRGRQ